MTVVLNKDAWVRFTRRTDDPKLAWIEFHLKKRGIESRRKGESGHAPILWVRAFDLADAWDFLTTKIDNIPDDNPCWHERYWNKNLPTIPVHSPVDTGWICQRSGQHVSELEFDHPHRTYPICKFCEDLRGIVMKKLTLIRDSHNRICWLGEKEKNRPDQQWLEGQSIPFEADAEFTTAYPLDGGSVIVDRKRVTVIGEFNTDAPAGERRHSALVALWHAMSDAGLPYTVTDFFHQYYNPKGNEQ
jgi:hypothetical protein